jgi:NACHT domain-containing protein
VAVGIAGVIGTDLATLHANETNFRWWWPTGWMVAPAAIFVVGLLLLFVPLRRSPPTSRAAIRRFSRFEQRYRKFVEGGNTRYVDTKGLMTVGFHTPELDDVFVDVSLMHRPPQDVPTGPLDDTSVVYAERLALEDLIGVSEPKVLAILGGPGTGKTTLLHYTARHTRRRHRRQHLPVLLYLREHSSAIVKQPDIGLADLIRNAIGELKTNEPPAWFEQKLRNGECVVLLDGLDEIPENQDRKVIATWIERQIQQYQDNHYIITSRPLGYRAARIRPAEIVQVRSFTTDQMERFIYGWYRATERVSTGAEGDDLLLRTNSLASDLLRRLAASPALSDLAANPLLLTMIVNVHRFSGALPDSRADLYKEICQVMLSRRQDAKNLGSKFTNLAKETLLSGLAYTMMTKRVSRGLPREEILDEIKVVLPRLSRKVKAEDFLADVGTNGLLVEGERGQYRFAHHTFQEYMAASYIRENGLVSVLAESVDDPWWRETSLLYAAHADADAIVEACLNSGSASALGLAFDCASQPSNLSADLRDRIDELLASIFELDSDQDSRRLISRTLIMRYLHQQIHMNESSLAWTRPVSENLYLLYIADVEQSIPNASIKGEWDDQTPALGMRASDAAGFVQWLNRIIDEKRGYRLPKPSELSVAVARRLLPEARDSSIENCVWTASDLASPPELWVPPGSSHPYAIRREDLFTHVLDDFSQSGQTLVALVLLRATVTARLLTRHLERNPGSHPSGAASMAAELSRDLISWPTSHLNIGEAYERANVIRQFCDREAKRLYSAKITRILAILRLLPRRRTRDLASQLARDLHFDLALVSGSGITPINNDGAENNGSLNTEYILTMDLFRDLLIGHENNMDRLFGDHFGALGNFPDANQVMSKILPVALVQALAIPAISMTWLRDAAGRFADASHMFGKTELGVSETSLSEAVLRGPDSKANQDTSISGARSSTVSIDALIAGYNPEFSDFYDYAPISAQAKSSSLLTVLSVKQNAMPSIFRRILASRNTVNNRSEEIVFPDGLADDLRASVSDISKLVGGGRNKGMRGQAQERQRWIADMSDRLREQATPALENRASVERGVAAGIRLAALCLAAEAVALGEVGLGAKFQQIAAGITVLERRSSGVVPAAEIIVLVPE